VAVDSWVPLIFTGFCLYAIAVIMALMSEAEEPEIPDQKED
jgi:hypothetical protein